MFWQPGHKNLSGRRLISKTHIKTTNTRRHINNMKRYYLHNEKETEDYHNEQKWQNDWTNTTDKKLRET